MYCYDPGTQTSDAVRSSLASGLGKQVVASYRIQSIAGGQCREIAVYSSQ
jgi:hypothetical protein